jgi:hypothetical protein
MAIPNIFKLIDPVFAIGLTASMLSDKREDYMSLRNDQSTAVVLDELTSLDAKSNSLLQHLSIMIASLSITFAVNTSDEIKLALLLNIVSYLVVVLLTLRVITFIDTSRSEDRHIDLIRELILRERYYLFAHSIASILTSLLVVSIISVLIYCR